MPMDAGQSQPQCCYVNPEQLLTQGPNALLFGSIKGIATITITIAIVIGVPRSTQKFIGGAAGRLFLVEVVRLLVFLRHVPHHIVHR